jgi:hypothetical protein
LGLLSRVEKIRAPTTTLVAGAERVVVAPHVAAVPLLARGRAVRVGRRRVAGDIDVVGEDHRPAARTDLVGEVTGQEIETVQGVIPALAADFLDGSLAIQVWYRARKQRQF